MSHAVGGGFNHLQGTPSVAFREAAIARPLAQRNATEGVPYSHKQAICYRRYYSSRPERVMCFGSIFSIVPSASMV